MPVTVVKERPTLFLSNFSSRRTPGMHGPGRLFSIMARPRPWERGEGAVANLCPDASLLLQVKRGEIAVEIYRADFEKRVQDALGKGYLQPSLVGAGRFASPSLTAYTTPTSGRTVTQVADGDTLCCACSKADAEAGRCHRAWAAPFIVRAGWDVVLDGRRIEP